MNSGNNGANFRYIDSNKTNAILAFSDALYQTFTDCMSGEYQNIIIMCIGTDRSTGDSLGPVVGYKLRGMNYNNVHVYGDLESPVHAKNLQEITKNIYRRHAKPFVIAIDASLGKAEHVGFISVGKGSIKPGSALNKELEPVGHMNVTGIVNAGGFMEFLILQNTRLGTVMKIADIVATGIKYVLWKVAREKVPNVKGIAGMEQA
ncbi:MAG TPA: spore protease YyaC [Ruminiclostridium sp.]|nr:spore protease YyaC [Ruminiclostridium sp.]